MFSVKKETDSPWRMLGLTGAFGMEITAFTVGGIFLGRFLDNQFASGPLWLVICTLCGLLAGFLSVFYTLKTILKD